MDHPVADELRALEARDHPEDTLLLPPLELGLEADHRVMAGGQVVLPELDDREGPRARARVDQAHRLHRPEEQRLLSAAGDDLDRKAAFEEELVLEGVQGRALGADEGAMEGAVLRLAEGAVDVVVAPLPVAGGLERLREVVRIGLHDRAHRVVEIEVGIADEGRDLRRQRLRGQGAGGDDGHLVLGQPRHLAAMQADLGPARHRLAHPLREQCPVDRERASRGHPYRVGDPDDERVHPAHLFLEQAGGLVEGVAAQAVGADELGQAVGLVHRRGLDRAHLVEVHADAAAGELPGGLAPGEPPANDRHALSHCPLTQRTQRKTERTQREQVIARSEDYSAVSLVPPAVVCLISFLRVLSVRSLRPLR